MPRQISDEDFARLQARMAHLEGRAQVADFVESIYNDPALTKDAKRLIKRKYPQMQIPDLDIEDMVETRFAEEQKKRDEADTARRQKTEEEDFHSKRAAAQKRYSLTEEGLQDLEKFMVEKNVGDYDIAASYRIAKDPKASNPDFNTGRWDHEKQTGFAEIAKDPEGWGRSEILKAIYADQEKERGTR